MDDKFEKWQDFIEKLNLDGIEPQKLLPPPKKKKDDTEIQIETIFLQNGFEPKPEYVEVLAEAIKRVGTNYYRVEPDINAVINSLLLAFLQNLTGNKRLAVLRSIFFFGVAIGHLFDWQDIEQ